MKKNLFGFVLLAFSLSGATSFADSPCETGQRICLQGSAAENLYRALPDQTKEIYPGAILKTALQVTCTSYPNPEVEPFASCNYFRVSDKMQLPVIKELANKLFESLPIELSKVHSGSLIKKASRVSCSSHPMRSAGTRFLCRIDP